eukprot:IDg11032t1
MDDDLVHCIVGRDDISGENSALTDTEFRRAFSLPRFEPEVRVAIVSRFMASASYLNMLILWGVAKNTIFKMFADAMDALIEKLPLPALPGSLSACTDLTAKLKIS